MRDAPRLDEASGPVSAGDDSRFEETDAAQVDEIDDVRDVGHRDRAERRVDAPVSEEDVAF